MGEPCDLYDRPVNLELENKWQQHEHVGDINTNTARVFLQGVENTGLGPGGKDWLCNKPGETI